MPSAASTMWAVSGRSAARGSDRDPAAPQVGGAGDRRVAPDHQVDGCQFEDGDAAQIVEGLRRGSPRRPTNAM